MLKKNKRSHGSFVLFQKLHFCPNDVKGTPRHNYELLQLEMVTKQHLLKFKLGSCVLTTSLLRHRLKDGSARHWWMPLCRID